MHNQRVIHQNAYTHLRDLMPHALPQDLRAIDIAAEAAARFAELVPFTADERDALLRPLEVFTRRALRKYEDKATRDVLSAYSMLGIDATAARCDKRLHHARAAAWAVARGQIYAYTGSKVPEHLWEIIHNTRAPYIFASEDGAHSDVFPPTFHALRLAAQQNGQRLVIITVGSVLARERVGAEDLDVFRFTMDPDSDRKTIHALLAHTRRVAWVPPLGWPGNE